MTPNSEIRGKTKNKAGYRENSASIKSRLHELRQARGLGTSEIARRVGVSRQTIYAIESGEFVPNTAVALHLARLLEVSVEELFTIGTGISDQSSGAIDAELLTTVFEKHPVGELVRIGRVGTKTIAAPVHHFPTFLSDADGTVASRNKAGATIRPLTNSASNRDSLVIAGCDPALSLLSAELNSAGAIVINIPCTSQEALSWLKQGLVHVAGTHLRDRTTGEYNLPLIRTIFGNGDIRVVTFAEWKQGLVVQRGNPKRIRSIADLEDVRINIVNREKGSGARDLLDTQLSAVGLSSRKIKGYDRIVRTHLVAACAVADGQADCCVATISAARYLGLDFIPISNERFDLVVATSEMSNHLVRSMLESLNRGTLRRKLETLAGYSVRHTGEMIM